MSKSNHKFFERYLDNNLNDLTNFLLDKHKSIFAGEFIGISKEDILAHNNNPSAITQLGKQYNAFQFYNKSIYSLYLSIREMVKEACTYYDVDYEKQNYMIQGWFNLDYSVSDGGNPQNPLENMHRFHDHLGGSGVPNFHGYYCVSAEPSVTYYKINNGEVTENVNYNNRAIVSETGHPHAIGDWSWQGPRITLAYDIAPLSDIEYDTQQHWIPLG
jgi:hypothetical protein